MKRSLFLMLILACCSMAVNCNNTAAPVEESVALKPAKIIVYYFHYTRRCATCNAVEDVTKQALQQYYAAKMKSGDITFKSVNIEEKAGEELANQLKVAGQALIVLKGDKQTDITEKGFMYALSEPDKLKTEVKKAVDAALK